MWKNRIIRNAGWLIGGRLVNKVLSFLVGILTARYLGPDNYGIIGYVTAYITFFASVCNLGINSVLVKDFVDHPEDEGKAMGTAMVLRAVSSALSALMIIGIIALTEKGDPTTVMVAVLSCVGLMFQVVDTLKRWFLNRLQSKYAAIATVLAYLSVSVYKLILLASGSSVVWFALATSVEYAVVAAFLLAAYRKNKGPRFAFSWKKAKELLQSSSSYILSDIMVSVYATTDKLMLKQMLDEAAVGYYTTAVAVSNVCCFVLEAMIESVYPSVIQSYKTDRELFKRKNRQLYAGVFYSAMIGSVVICLLSGPIVEILYGESYLPSVQPLRIVVWYTAFSYLGGARGAWMVCEDKQKYLKYLSLIAAVENVILNLVLIPHLGPSGAALASLLTQITTIVVIPALIKPLRPNAKLMLEAVLLKGVLKK